MSFKIINESGVDSFLAIKFMNLLTKPFIEWEAYKLGLIDEEGLTIRKSKTKEEKASLSLFTIVVKNIKKIMLKIPSGRSKFASYAAAFFLLKEHQGIDDNEMNVLIESFKHYIKDDNEFVNNECISKGHYKNLLNEDIIILEDLKPIANAFNINIYTIKNRLTNENILFTEQEIK